MKAKIKPRIILEGRESLEEAIPLETPWVIFVDPSDACNFRCKFCPTGNLELMKSSSRTLRNMDFKLYTKIVDDICEFENPVKVLRLYKDGEPLLNRNFHKMVEYAKKRSCAESIDTTSNGSLLSPHRNIEIIEAGLDRINISVEGVSAEQYKDFSGVIINFDKFVDNISHFYDNRNQCKVFIKINGDIISDEDKVKFYEIFGDICDYINIEHTMNCWNNFEMKDTKQNTAVGVYGQEIHEVEVCPYPFYSFSINSNGYVSLCFLDWNRKLIIGNVNHQSVKEVWNGNEINAYRNLFLNKRRRELKICKNCSQLSHGMPVDLDDCANELLKKIGVINK